jgi:molybdopterin/thiamine biosynthesis adenylyltransferase
MASPPVQLRALPDRFAAFARELLASAPDEAVAQAFAGWWLDPVRGLTLLLRDWQLAPAEAYERRGGAGAVVRPEFLAPGIKRARGSNEAVLLCHTHPFSEHPGFSGIDDGGEDVLIPKVRDRAPDAPHGAIVVGQRGAEVRIWPPGLDRAISASLRVFDSPVMSPADSRFDRQDRALGPGTSRVLGLRAVGIIGTGGLGWDAATLLAGHGVGRLVLVDPDIVEENNRPRLRGASPGSVGRPKVEALADLIRASTPEIAIESFATALADASARRALAGVDLLISATDNLGSRLDTDRFARRLLLPLIDVGINVHARDRELHRVGGRMSILWPTGPCLLCMGVLTPDAVAAEADPLGYRGDGRQAEAAVASFNAVLAGLAVTEALMLLLGARKDVWRSRYLVYDGLAARVGEIAVPEAGACGTCQDLAGAVFGVLP